MLSSRLKRPALALACALACAPLMAATPVAAPEIVGYYPGWKSDAFAVTAANVGAGKLTMVLYAFVDVCWDGKHGNADPTVNDVAPCQDAAGEAASADGALVLRDAASDGANLQALVALKRRHPGFKVVVSVGGWNWSNRFSNVADAPAARAAFIASAVKTMRRHGLDGIDIDWEYPGEAGVPCVAGEVCARPADKRNFITLARELRAAFDAAGREDRKHYSITIAAGGNASYVNDGGAASGWLRELASSLDWINIMAYDYHMPWERRSGHHAALHGDARDPVTADGFYAAASVRRYLEAGVAARQLVLGVPFYGYGWKGCPPGANGDGQYQACDGAAAGGVDGGNSYGYGHLLKQGYLAPAGGGGGGYRRYWNAAARAPYLYNAAQQVWITYEDPASLKEKAAYIKAQGLRGAMFWELSADDGHQLLNALSAAMRR
ncbi:chitinase [Janthinobacterium sp. HH01]|uniref:glycoside hydrolase family 18 protein n=1 Tax=Janthinobacterium sp. HH01 TaxID=1198452 RepID=UPI0002AE9601|nr:glycoside hydrolase family 18 protein [Janthinobacterium sp. HH01]ELX13092.1 chitinase [Janthinobacterium sp. HH01]